MKKTFRLLGLALFATLMAVSFSACSDDDDENPTPEPEQEEILPEDNFLASDEQIPALTYCFSGIRSDLDGALKMRFYNFATEIVPAVKVVIVPAKSLTGDTGRKVAKAYRNEKLIIVTEPTDAILSQWAEENELGEISLGEMAAEASSEGAETKAAVSANMLVYSFNNSGSHSIVDDPADGKTIEASQLNKYLNAFTTWVNKVSTPILSGSDMGDLSKYFNQQSYHHTFSIDDLQNRVAYQYVGSDPDYISGEGTMDLYLDITPLHVFDDQQNSGDYYICHANVVAHNDQLYFGKFTGSWHGICRAYIAGFMMSKQKVRVQVEEGTNAEFTTDGTPQPKTTEYNTTHTEGTTVSLNGSVTGGLSGSGPSASATVGGGISWSKSNSVTYPDIMIQTTSSGSTAVWEYKVNPDGLGHFVRGNSSDYNPPTAKVCITDLGVEMWWVWHMPDIKDNDDTKVKISCTVWPQYFTSATGDAIWGPKDEKYHGDGISLNKKFIYLTPPNRKPTGNLVLKNNFAKGFVDNIRLYRDGQLIYTFDNEIDPDEDLSRWVETGKYDIQFTQQERKDGKLVETNYISTRKIEIQRGETRTIHTDNYFEPGTM